ncbi:STAS domain-containing protein [Streptomyces sp. NPDC059918]|uniref:STAS domain-containing protein n=1 Tax=unclassified Streptomyces TaxID=2593676 RepID=UPI00366172D0
MNHRDPYRAEVRLCPPHCPGGAQAACTPQNGRRTVVCLSGEFDADTIHAFREVLGATGSSMRLVVDLTGVTFADSSLLHALLDARHRIVLAGPLPRQFRRLLDRTGTMRQFTTTPEADASAAARACGR